MSKYRYYLNALSSEFNFFRYNAPGESGWGFFKCNGFGRPDGVGICYEPEQTYGGEAMSEYHHGWLLAPPDAEGRAMPYPPTTQEEEAFCSEMLEIADQALCVLKERTIITMNEFGLPAILDAAKAILPNQSTRFFPKFDKKEIDQSKLGNLVPSGAGDRSFLAMHRETLPADFNRWRTAEDSGWTLAHERVSAGYELPSDFDGWHWTDHRGWSVAHEAAANGVLPKNLDPDLWFFEDLEGVTVAHVAAYWGNLPPDFEYWHLADGSGETVLQVAVREGQQGIPEGIDDAPDDNSDDGPRM